MFRSPAPTRGGVAAAALAATLVACIVPIDLVSPAPAEAATSATSATSISSGSLVWGFKESFRKYTGAADGTPGALTVRGGASAGAAGVVSFPVADGTFDPSTKSTKIDFSGSMQFRAHCEGGLGLPAGACALDLTFSDLQIAITPTEQVLRAHLVGRRNTDGYPFVDNGVIAIANLDIAPAKVADSSGTTSWTGIVASLAADAAAPTTYSPATPLDPVAFSYLGPGDKPATGDQFTPPGSHTIVKAAGWTGPTLQNQPATVYVDDRNHVVHLARAQTSFDPAAPAVTALDLPDLHPVGSGSQALASDYANNPTAFDPETGTVFITARDKILAETWTGGGYTKKVVGPVSSAQALVWNTEQGSLQALASDGDGLPALTTFTRRGHAWVGSTLPLPVPDDQDPYSYYVAGSATSSFAALSDGDLIVARGFSVDAAGAVDNNPDPLLLRPTATDVAVEVIPITTHPHGDSAPAPDASMVTTGPQNRAAFYGSGNTGFGPSIRLATVTAGSVSAAEPAALPLAAEEPLTAGFDPTDGTVWIKGVTSGTLVGLLDGKTVAKLVDADTARAYTLQVAADHTIITAGRTAGSYPSVTAYARLGVSPTVTAEPSSTSAPSGADVTFSAAATGSPEPEVQWQQRPPGTTAFADIAGATAETLTVRASEQDSGVAYRAVFRNPAGTIASQAAILQVLSAPTIGVQPSDHTVVAGAAATFQVMSAGTPEPTVTWQYGTGGNWVDVVAGTAFVLGAGTLTIPHVNSAQNGMVLRAKVVNSQGVVYSRTATLTVTAAGRPGSGAGTYRDVSLVWSGNPVLQKPSPAGPGNYLSAGVSDGSKSGYRAGAGNVTVQERVDGRTSTASYATRNAFAKGGQQWVWLRHGTAVVRSDRSATVSWIGSWSVNFYGGLAPFTLTNPTLTLDRNGTGTLRADLSGYGSSQADPNHKTKLTPVRGVTVSNVRGVRLDTTGATTVEPGYRGVRVGGIPASAQPQDTSRAGWGAWPQSFIDFQFKTGLSSYWYSSGGAADADKPGLPFVVDFASARPAPPPTGSARPGDFVGSSIPTNPGIEPPADTAGIDAAGTGALASTGTNLRLTLLAAALLLVSGMGLSALSVAARRRAGDR